MRPENISVHIEHGLAQRRAEQMAYTAKAAAKAVFLQDRKEQEARSTQDPCTRFDTVWTAIVEQISTPFDPTDKEQLIADTPAKIIPCKINGKEVELSLSFRIQAVDGRPFVISSLWEPLNLKNDPDEYLYEIEERAYTNVRYDDLHRESFREHEKDLTGLANIESSLRAYLASEQYLPKPATNNSAV